MNINLPSDVAQTTIDPYSSHWEVVLTTGKVLTEYQLVYDFGRACHRQIDWSLDLNTTGDLYKIKELWLICPGGHRTTFRGGVERPIRLEITEPGTAFQFKHGTFNTLGVTSKNVEAQIIGKITNKEDGDCICWIWDRIHGLIEYQSNINNFGMWRPNSGLIPLTKLSLEVVGLRLN